ncbi:cell division protein SepF [Kamptonema cortianum]|mgnify:CR=1 FL=1|nr:cell division protein SepF [Geitlerinema splendidum]MDK3157624.1 cell division protein SepF [Kamptonema cortianum]
MEETLEQPGLFGRIRSYFTREDEYEDDFDSAPARSTSLRVHASARYTVSVRRQVVSFQDAVVAADGLKRGEQQILNLSMCAPELREKIKDFMCGVNYNAEGTWEELGEHVYLLAPPSAHVDVAPATPRMAAGRN